MARIARIVYPGVPHHVTHRGNRGEPIFAEPNDRRLYLRRLTEYADRFGLGIWAYCLMTNHVHLIAVPTRRDSLARAIGNAHRHFARLRHERSGWTGHLWANRFYSAPLDEAHLWAAVRYVESNPVRAGLAERAETYRWSSARAHARGEPDGLLSSDRPFPGPVSDWSGWLADGGDADRAETIRVNTRTGRPCGSEGFVRGLESALGRTLRTVQGE